MRQSLNQLIKSRSLHLNQIMIWNSICKDYATKVDLNMNPACSARLCMNGADARFCLLTLHVVPSAVSMRTYIYEQYLQNCSESHFTSILPFHLSKTSVISYTHRTLKVFTATRQNKSSVKLIKDIVPEIGYINII